MADDQEAPQTQEDELSKEFDEIVEHAEEKTDEGAVNVAVRRDTTPLEEPVVQQQEAAAPVVTTQPAAPQVPVTTPTHNSGATMVLQWLSYAFWGWFGVAMGWLSGVTIGYFVSGNSADITSSLAYPLASVIVMFILAAVTDFLYVRREPLHKQGGPNAIMLVHVVLFVLIAVGSAVTGLFALISMLLNTDPTMGTEAQSIVAWTSLVLLVTFAMIAARALLGGRVRKIRMLHWIVMAALGIGMIVAAIAGPVVGAQVTKDDRLIEEGLPTLVAAVSSYVNENDKLPDNLAAANDSYQYATPASKSLVSRSLVKYKPNVMEAISLGDGTTYSGSKSSYWNSTTYYYEVCVTYKQVKKAGGTYSDSMSGATKDGYYPSYLSISSHPKGEVCYKRSASTGYGDVYPVDAITGATTSKQ